MRERDLYQASFLAVLATLPSRVGAHSSQNQHQRKGLGSSPSAISGLSKEE
jgi:hypothetical protein